MNKSFTLIILSYNCAKYIIKNLLSIINADYDKNIIQVIVIDDGSTDNSVQIINRFSKKYNFIEFYVKKNGQCGFIINYAKNNSLIKNDYVAILDEDDFYNKNVFKIINKIANNNDIVVRSYKKYNGLKLKQKIFPYWFLFKRKIYNKQQMFMLFCLLLIFFVKKEIFYKLNDLTEKMSYQDRDYLSKLVKNTTWLVFTWKIIGYYYYNRENNSMSQLWHNKRFAAEPNACFKSIENDAQEIVSYCLNIKKFYKMIHEKNIIFQIKKKFNFSWYLFYLKWIYILIHQIKYATNLNT